MEHGRQQADSSVIIRQSPTAPGVIVYDYELLAAESYKIDHLILDIELEMETMGRYDDFKRREIRDVLDIIFEKADVQTVVGRCLGLDTEQLEEEVQLLLYLFAVGQTGLIRPTDAEGSYTTDTLTFLDKQVWIGHHLPQYIDEVRETGDYERFHSDLEIMLRHLRVKRKDRQLCNVVELWRRGLYVFSSDRSR